MARRDITRLAFLQEYEGRPLALLDLIDEVKRKGYDAVVFAAAISKLDQVRELAAAAHASGLRVYTFTGYMKYQYTYLAEHPEQRLVTAEECTDQDGLSTVSWGCPFNPDFKKRYFDFLRELAIIPGLEEIWVNDEASLGTGCYCAHCRAAFERDLGGEMPLMTDAAPARWEDERWRRFLRWRIDRWNRVHGEMKTAIRGANPDVRAVFQASPSEDLCWHNPWYSAVDLSSMVDVLDGLCTDPYYTFHPRRYNPAEVYLSEWCRFLRGIVPADKKADIIPQAFSHPTFTRPLDERDGYWAALVPVACGIDCIAPYTYKLMAASPPLIESYEKSFVHDSRFAEAEPLSYVGVVHGANTEMFSRPFPIDTPGSYDGSRMLPCTESLRHRGLPYSYLPDSRLSPEMLRPFEVVVLPEIECLDPLQEDAIRAYWENGGNLVVLGQLGVADAMGARHGRSLLTELTGIEVVGDASATRQMAFVAPHQIQQALPSVDEEAAAKYSDGALHPLTALTNCRDVKVQGTAKVLAEFTDTDGRTPGSPAVVEYDSGGDQGRLVYFAGFPSRTTTNPRYHTAPRNLAHWLLPAVVEYVARRKPAVRVEDWPPAVPLERARPLDPRYLCTFELFALAGENSLIGMVASYFREPAQFIMVATVPEGRSLRRVSELIAGGEAVATVNGNEVRIDVAMAHDDAAKVLLFELDPV